MKVFLNINNLPSFNRSVVTIGSYDGVHLGHRQILKSVTNEAKKIDGESVLISFSPHPRIFLQGKSSNIKLLNTIHEKIKIVEKLGIDHLVIVPFDHDFASQQPIDYIKDFLVENFHPKTLIIGYDHKFGRDRKGDINLLQRYSSEFDFDIKQIEKQTIDELAISSTKIRNAISEGKMTLASELLGDPYILSGKVVRGKQIGRDLGYPTANIELNDQYKLIPPEGVFVVKIACDGTEHWGMMYIGRRPTLNDGQDRSIEVNIFDFEENIYDRLIRVEVLKYVRSDQRFESLEKLKLQLAKDKENTLDEIKKIIRAEC